MTGVEYRRIAAHGATPITFLDSRGTTAATTHDETLRAALVVAARLGDHGLKPDDPVIVSLPTGVDFLPVMLGALLSGVTPCVVAPPRRTDVAAARHLNAAVDVIRPVALVSADEHLELPSALPRLSPRELTTGSGVAPVALPRHDPDSIHHIQLTSGSTSAPKAVALTHRGVAANIAALAELTAVRVGEDRVLSWLPLYHDMGLIQVLSGLVNGLALDLMPPTAFVRDPLSWIRHISANRATCTAAPPFAYHLAANRLRSGEDFDLSSLRNAFVGAEPISLAALRLFRDGFAPHGLADEALLPSYGMAETVLATTVAHDSHHRDHTVFGRVRAIEPPGETGLSEPVVSCGSPIPGLRYRLDVADGASTGAIHVTGSSVMAGHLTAHGVVPPPNGWHDTGDIGMVHDDELYIVGRSKEMLIVRGRNLPPYDIEAVVERHPDVVAGGAVVFSSPKSGRVTEAVVAVVETRANSSHWQRIRDELTLLVRQEFQWSFDEVIVMPRGRLPRTSSGKRQRTRLRRRYLAGELS